MRWHAPTRIGILLVLSALPFLLLPKARPSTSILLTGLAIGLGVSIGAKQGVPVSWQRRFRLLLSVTGLACIVWFLVWGLQTWDQGSRNLQLFAALVLIGASLLVQSRFRRWMEAPTAPLQSIQDVLPLELDWIRARRQAVGMIAEQPSAGLALSGGGLRSAAVCLGFLSESFDLGMLKSFDYLSTVSGGGWAGAAVGLLFANSTTPDETDWKRLFQIFRQGRDYLARTALCRGLWVMAIGAMVVALGLTLLLWATVGFLYWVEILDHMKEIGKTLRYDLRPLVPPFLLIYLSDAPRAPNFLDRSLQSVLPLAAAIIVILTIFVLCVNIFGRFTRWIVLVSTSNAPLVFLIRVTIAVMALLFVLQGREMVTAAVFTGIIALALGMFARITTIQHRVTLVAIVVLMAFTLAWLFKQPELLARCTDFWHCLVAEAIGFEWRVAGSPGSVTCVAGGPPMWRPTKEATGTDVIQFFDVAIVAGLSFTVFGFYMNRSRTALFRWWRDCISRSFLLPVSAAASAPFYTIRDRGAATRGAPLAIINAAVNLPGSLKAFSGASRFEMTPFCFGGPVTGWAPAEAYKESTFADCIALSAAAVNTQGGSKIPRYLGWILLLTNFRLGIWMRNPRSFARTYNGFRRNFVFAEIFKELAGTNNDEDSAVFVSDGGHDDNTGMSALCDRSCGVIVVVDAASDPKWDYGDLSFALDNLTKRGWSVRERLLPTRAAPSPLGRPGLGRIEMLGPDSTSTTIVLLKVAVADDALALMTSGAREYSLTHTSFPQESTADQWFTEAQFEAYFAVGRALARRLSDSAIAGLVTRPSVSAD